MPNTHLPGNTNTGIIPIKFCVNAFVNACLPFDVFGVIIALQKNLQYMLKHDYAKKRTTPTYSSLQSLLQKYEAMKAATTTDPVSTGHGPMHKGILFPISLQLSADEEYLLAATVLDCSIMITFQEFHPHQMDHELLRYLSVYTSCKYIIYVYVQTRCCMMSFVYVAPALV